MARRRIGQEEFIARSETRRRRNSAELATLLGWAEINRHFVGISTEATGSPAGRRSLCSAPYW